MKRLTCFFILGIFGLYLSGCEKNPIEPEPELKIDSTVEKIAPLGWSANHIINSSAEIEEVTNISQYLEEDGVDGVPGIGTLRRNARSLLSQASHQSIAHQNLMKSYGLMKPSADSLIFFQDNKVFGVRKALYYNFENGIARYYEVKYKFAAWRNLTYDSTQVRVDLNQTLEDSLDDAVLDLFQLQQFKESFFIQKIENKLTVTDTDGKEITGIELVKETQYQPTRFLIHLQQFIRLEPNKSGELREDFTFKDGKTSFKKVVFYADNTGIFEELKRDGTRVNGKFDSVEDDGEGYYEELTDFPEGRYIDKIAKSAQLTLSLPDSTLNTKFVESITFNTGKTVTDSARVITSEDAGIKYITLHYFKHNGEHGTLNMIEDDGSTTLTGNWTTVDNFYIVLSAEYYIDGSGHIHFEVFVSETDYNAGADPLIVADYYFSPDGTGTGTLSYEGKSYEISFNESGEAEISMDGQKTRIELFQ